MTREANDRPKSTAIVRLVRTLMYILLCCGSSKYT